MTGSERSRRCRATFLVGVGSALVGLMASSCGGSRGHRPVVSTDSAGVEVVANAESGVDDAPLWSLSDTPTVDIRAADTADAPVLFDIVGLCETRRGRIAVGNRGTQQVLVYDSVGGLVEAFGGQGEGPDQLMSLRSIVSLGGDSIGVYDQGRQRVAVYGPDGHVARSFATTQLTVSGGSSWLTVLSDGQFILMSEARTDAIGVHRSRLEAYRLSAAGAPLATLGPFEGDEGFVSQSGRRGGTLFGPRTQVVALRDELVVGTAGVPQLDVYDVSGRLLRVVRWPDRRRDVTTADVAHYVEAAVAAVPEPQRPMVRQMLSATPASRRFPVYDRVLESTTGNLWVGIYSPPALTSGVARYPARRWLVVGADGAIQARLRTPEGFDMRVVDQDEVIGVYIDSLGEESVRIYALHRG
jgi:hypothetical protein